MIGIDAMCLCCQRQSNEKNSDSEHSELQPQCELHFASEAGAGDSAKGPGADLQRGRVEGRSICEIVILPPELDLLRFGNRKILEHSEIQADQSRGGKNIAAAVPIMAARSDKGGGVKPAVQSALVGV